MNILWVARRRLLPVNSGGRIRTMFTLRELARRGGVTVLSSYEAPAPDRAYETELAQEFPGSRAIWSGPGTGKVTRALNVASGLLPLAFNPVRTMTQLQRRIDRELSSGMHDIAVFDFLESASLLPARRDVPVVLIEHNVESDLLRDQSGIPTARLARLSLRIRARSLRNIEAAAVRRFDHTIAFSEHDVTRLRDLAGHDRVTAVPTGADARGMHPKPLPQGEAPVVLFTGLMNYPPNIDAVTWFCAEIWPLVLAEVPIAHFRIAGRNPAPAVRALASESVAVTGEVPDMAVQFAEASVVVVPLRVGSGTRLKIFEAMACGRPVISTRLGAAGLAVRDGDDIVFADESADFARQVVRLLQDRDAALQIAEAAAQTAVANSWEVVVESFERVLQSVVESHRAHRA